MGGQYKGNSGKLLVNGKNVQSPVKLLETGVYPGFPTDMQSIFATTLTTAKGTSVIVENIFENRYRHIPELVRMGAAVKTEGKVAVAEGVEILYGASVEAPDLRGGAALVVAGLCAEGKTEIGGVEYIERGYECIESTLTSIGADIKKI